MYSSLGGLAQGLGPGQVTYTTTTGTNPWYTYTSPSINFPTGIVTGGLEEYENKKECKKEEVELWHCSRHLWK
jgi:hypothetical protein